MTKGTIVRTIILALALVNQLLVTAGYAPLPFSDEQLEQMFADGFVIVSAIIAWWKNNSFTKAAIEADKALKEVKLTAKQPQQKQL